MDGAHAGTAGLLPELRHHFDGLELADSYDINPHKCGSRSLREDVGKVALSYEGGLLAMTHPLAAV